MYVVQRLPLRLNIKKPIFLFLCGYNNGLLHLTITIAQRAYLNTLPKYASRPANAGSLQEKMNYCKRRCLILAIAQAGVDDIILYYIILYYIILYYIILYYIILYYIILYYIILYYHVSQSSILGEHLAPSYKLKLYVHSL